MSKKIVIIGGGIVGLCSAYYLNEDGHDVRVIDKSNFSRGASYINAGYITPSHIIPLSAPGMITKGLKWMFDSSSPFYVKPNLNPEFLKWGLAFKKSATLEKVNKAIPIIKDINILSRELYQELKDSSQFDFHYEHKGLLMLCKTEKGLEAERKVAKLAIKEGLAAKEVKPKEFADYESEIGLDIAGAIFYDCDAHMTPPNFMKELVQYLKKQGVKIYAEERVEELIFTENRISEVITHKQTIKADEVVLAAGSWSAELAKQLGIKILLQPGKGYSINVNRPTGIKLPGILAESKIAVTPMNGFTRFSGTMEIDGINHDIKPQRVRAIAEASQTYYQSLEINESEIAEASCGLRPCSPDGLPYIGKSVKMGNLIFATGHAMMGWSLGPATGKLISEIISEKKLSMNIDAFHPDRKF
ncbi:MAG: FAD-dependent oxidoreductase [Flavobacteriaceae bacterium]|nr:FAD-dependent oxidoreductase [Flavobacteriaceae bacterium]